MSSLVLSFKNSLKILKHTFGITILLTKLIKPNSFIQVYPQKNACFSVEEPAHGTPKWMLMNELKTRKFTDENWEFLMELSVSNAMTVFEGLVKIPHVPHHASGQKTRVKLETSYFTFGNFEWNVSVLPNGDETTDGTR